MKDYLEKLKELSKEQLILHALKMQSKLSEGGKADNEPIAVIGAACRFPGGCNSFEVFWSFLKEGKNAVSEIPSNDWDINLFYDSNPDVPGRSYSKWAALLNDNKNFDPEFFGISPREGIHIDPQQRLLLETNWEALEHAGQSPGKLKGSNTGVFVAASGLDFVSLKTERQDINDYTSYCATGLSNSVAAGRISYIFDLTGPSLSVDTACSSSLTAVHLAFNSLQRKECDLAMVSAVNVILRPEGFVMLSKARMLSSSGQCQAFDKNADGYVRGEGCGTLILKRFSDSENDNDNVLAIIKGSALNHNGKGAALTAPNTNAQKALIRKALKSADVQPDQIDYVETHGTGTELGDRVEVESLESIYGSTYRKRMPLLIGSVKANLGHLETAAGMAGIFKVILSLKNGEIPKQILFNRVNEELNLDRIAACIPEKTVPWPNHDKKKTAGISSFGFSGTNVHMILEEAPNRVDINKDDQHGGRILNVSAKTEAALMDQVRNLKTFLADQPDASLDEICYGYNTGRVHHKYRFSFLVDDKHRLNRQLDDILDRVIKPKKACDGSIEPIGFLFKDQGTLCSGFGKKLYEINPLFKEAIDQSCQIAGEIMGDSLIKIIFDHSEPAVLSQKAVIAHSALFSIEYALASLWRSWGVKPGILTGLGIGEYVAACLADVFSLEEALKLIIERGRLTDQLPTNGSMTEVFAGPEIFAQELEIRDSALGIAGINGPESCTISGETRSIQEIELELEAKGISFKRLKVPHALNSVVMEPILSEYYRFAGNVNYKKPKPALISGLTGELVKDGSEITAKYWADQAVGILQGKKCLETFKQQKCKIIIEIGPDGIAPKLLKSGTYDDRLHYPPSLRSGGDEWGNMLGQLAELYGLGLDIDWDGFYGNQRHRKIALPTYPFERKRLWAFDDLSSPKNKADQPGLTGDTRARCDNQKDGKSMPNENQATETESNNSLLDKINHASGNRKRMILSDFIKSEIERSLQLSKENGPDGTISFFEIGVDSLIIMEIVDTLQRRLDVRLSADVVFQNDTIETLTTYLIDLIEKNITENGKHVSDKKREGEHLEPIAINTADEKLPLSYGQKRLWFLSRFDDQSIAYNRQVAMNIFGDLDTEVLKRCIQTVISRHEILRTSFREADGIPYQSISEQLTLDIPILDHSDSEPNRIHDRLSEFHSQKIDLSQGPLFKVAVFRLSHNHHVFSFMAHHIIVDRWSGGIIIDEIRNLYSSMKDGGLTTLDDLPVQYKDYVAYQHNLLTEARLQELSDFWKTKLKDLPPLLQLPTDRPRPSIQTFNGAVEFLTIPQKTKQEITRICRSEKSTLFNFLLAAFKVLLSKYSGVTDICVGSPVANRSRKEFQKLVGFLVNTVVIRSEVSGQLPFKEYLKQVNVTSFEAFDHQDMPFEYLVDHLDIDRSLSHAPIFQILFSMQNVPSDTLDFGKLELTPFETEPQHTSFDLTFSAVEQTDGIRIYLEYNSDLFDGDRIKRMAVHYVELINDIIRTSEKKIHDLNILSDKERTQLLVGWNGTHRLQFDRENFLKDFDAQVNEAPDRVAIVHDDVQLTYRELYQRSNQLANYLIDIGIQSKTMVGVMLKRSPDIVIGFLGILRTGAAYIPIDPTYPKSRIESILNQSQCGFLLTQRMENTDDFDIDVRTVYLDSFQDMVSRFPETIPDRSIKPGDLAYMIYTSGSTGEPKGVPISHGAVANFLRSMRIKLDMTPDDVLLAVTTVSFDISVLELYLPLICGARVILAGDDDTYDGKRLTELTVTRLVTTLQGTPATWKLLMDADWSSNGRKFKMLCGGEAMPQELADELIATDNHLFNLYGPTETTVWSLMKSIEGEKEYCSSVIGKPIHNTEILILDKNLTPVPIGVPGNLYIGGDGVSKGYYNNPALTKQKFIRNPFDCCYSKNIYDTGDIARYLSNGDIEYIGRLDGRIKLRGFRIEITEIEAVLNRYHSIKYAVVAVVKSETIGKHLAAFLIPSEGSVDENLLRDFLQQFLPDYMIPTFFVPIDTLPLTANRKVDRKSLSVPESYYKRRDDQAAPETEIQIKIKQIFSEVLGTEHIGIYDNFFHLGGNSLLVSQVISKIGEILDIGMPLKAFFLSPTIESSARFIETISKTKDLNRSVFSSDDKNYYEEVI